MKHEALNTLKTVPLTQEVAISTAQNAPYLSLKNYRGLVITFYGDAGRSLAADDTTITLQQATDNSGGSAKAFTPRRAYLREGSSQINAISDAASEVAGDSLVTNGDGHSILDIEIDASELDLANDFAYIRPRFAAVSGGTRTARFSAIAYGPRHATNPENLANPRS